METAPELNPNPPRAVSTVRLMAYVVSDVHLSASPSPDETEEDHHFVDFMREINQQHSAGTQLTLVLNGDILDVTGSWHSSCLPWDPDTASVEAYLLSVLSRILARHAAIVEELHRFLVQGGEILYLFGNHDRLVGEFASAQALLRETLCPKGVDASRLQFCPHVEVLSLGLYVEHGNRFDPFNRAMGPRVPPVGDAINILIVNRFVDLAVEKLRAAGYSEDLVLEMQETLEQVENLRPLSLGPYWLTSVARTYAEHPEGRGKKISIDGVIREVMGETLLDDRLIRILERRFWVPGFLLRLAFGVMLAFPSVLPILSFLVSIMLHRTRSNQFQVRMAGRIQHETGLRLVTMGHTHLPLLEALSEEAYYVNTGCWKPVIHLFKHSERYLFRPSPFNRVERSGVFCVERDLAHQAEPVRFSLKTMQDGLS